MKRLTIAMTLLITAGFLGACKKEKRGKGQPPAAVKAAASAPKELIATIGVRAPGKVVDNSIGLVRKFADGFPFNRDMLIGMMLSQSGAPQALADNVDFAGTFWIVGFDEAQLGVDDPVLLAIPIKSKAGFQKAIDQTLKKKGAEGELTVYEPKRPGRPAVRVKVDDKVAIFASSKKAYEKGKDYLRNVLLKQKLNTDVEATMLVKHMKKLHAEVDKGLKQAFSNMGRKNPEASKSFEKWMNSMGDLIKSTNTARFTANVNDTGIQVAVYASGTSGGALEKMIKSEAGGAPYGIEHLPANVGLLAATRGQPKADDEAMAFLLQAMKKELDDKTVGEFKAIISDFVGAMTKNSSGAAYFTDQGRLVVSSVTELKDGAKLEGAVKRLVAWVKTQAEAKGGAAKLGQARQMLDFKMADLEHKGLKGRSYAVDLTKVLQASRMGRSERMIFETMGKTLTLAYGMNKKKLVGSLVWGGDATSELKRLIDGPKPSLKDASAFKRVAGKSGRAGWMYLSAVDIVRGLGKVLPPLKPLAADLKNVVVKSAMTLDWGVDASKTEYGFQLDIPAAHLLHFKKFFAQALGPRGGLGRLFR